jgi:hypothetical protein
MAASPGESPGTARRDALGQDAEGPESGHDARTLIVRIRGSRPKKIFLATRARCLSSSYDYRTPAQSSDCEHRVILFNQESGRTIGVPITKPRQFLSFLSAVIVKTDGSGRSLRVRPPVPAGETNRPLCSARHLGNAERGTGEWGALRNGDVKRFHFESRRPLRPLDHAPHSPIACHHPAIRDEGRVKSRPAFPASRCGTPSQKL